MVLPFDARTTVSLPACPKCNSEYTYEDGAMLICPECAHEWSVEGSAEAADDVVKVGTKVKNIRLVDGDHDIDCKIDGIGAMKLKSEFVRKG
jgi:protein PhnA